MIRCTYQCPHNYAGQQGHQEREKKHRPTRQDRVEHGVSGRTRWLINYNESDTWRAYKWHELVLILIQTIILITTDWKSYRIIYIKVADIFNCYQIVSTVSVGYHRPPVTSRAVSTAHGNNVF